jgi:hypothetical protein
MRIRTEASGAFGMRNQPSSRSASVGEARCPNVAVRASGSSVPLSSASAISSALERLRGFDASFDR